MIKEIEMNGTDTGIAVQIRGDIEPWIFIMQNERKKLFMNLQLAKSYLNSKYQIYNPSDYVFYIVANGKIFQFDDVYKSEYYYEIYDDNDIYHIYEKEEDKVVSINYLIFYDGEVKDDITDKKELYNLSKKLYKITKHAAYETTRFINPINGERIGRDKNGNLTIFVRNSSVKIHILTNSTIMDLNVKRKENNQRCIPFDKVDKFKSLYIYTTMDNNDEIEKREIDLIDQYLRYKILNYIETEYPETTPHWKPVYLKGYVLD